MKICRARPQLVFTFDNRFSSTGWAEQQSVRYRIFRLQASYLSATCHTGRKSCRVKSLYVKRFWEQHFQRRITMRGQRRAIQSPWDFARPKCKQILPLEGCTAPTYLHAAPTYLHAAAEPTNIHYQAICYSIFSAAGLDCCRREIVCVWRPCQ